MNTLRTLIEKVQQARWVVEMCHNPRKAWVRDGRKNRLSVLTSYGSCERIVSAHNKEIVYIESQIAPAIEAMLAENERLRGALEECEEYFDQRADADYQDDQLCPYVGNPEMTMLVAVRSALQPHKEG
jgi:hypothetical protein